LILRTVIWFVTVVASHPNAPLDLIEWLSWGHEWQWGSAKHPPLPAWIADVFSELSPGDVWGVYLAGYLVTAGCLLAAWQLGRRYLSDRYALIACLCLDGLMYYTNDPAEFSNNVMLNLGWAWLIVFFDRAIHDGSFWSWIAVGITAGLTLLCKYTVGVLFIVFALYILFDRDARKCLRTTGPYLAAVMAIVIVMPHLRWLWDHQFITFRYARERSTESDVDWTSHFFHPAMFVLGQTIYLLPVFLVLLPLLSFRGRSPEQQDVRRRTLFLHFVVLGPVALLLGLSIATGCVLREIWGSPLWTFYGVWFLANFRKAASATSYRWAIRCWVIMAIALLAFSVVKMTVGPYLSMKPFREHFPGKQLAHEVNALWAARYGGVPPIIGGEPWLAGNVCCYSKHRPHLYSSGKVNVPEMRPEDTTWVNDEMMNRLGGVILWDADADGDVLRADLRERFPRVEVLTPITLPYETNAKITPTRVGVAFVPPQR